MTWEEVIHLLKSSVTADEINAKRYEIAEWMPDIRKMFDCEQEPTHYQYDLWLHGVHTVLGIDKSIDDDMLYLAALVHGIEKVYGQTGKCVHMTKEIIWSLLVNDVEISDEDEERLLYYVRYHDEDVSLREDYLKRHLQMVSIDTFKNLMELKVADAKAQVMSPIIQERIDICTEWKNSRADEIKARLDRESVTALNDIEIYILAIESYEWTEIYGIYTNKELLLEKYLYLIEHSSDNSGEADGPGVCIYNPKLNEDYTESYYEICEGGLEWLGTKIPNIIPKDIWGDDVQEKIAISQQIAADKRAKEEWRRALHSV